MPLPDEMARQRAALYRWFSPLLFQELSTDALAELASEPSIRMLNGLATIPALAKPTLRFQQCVHSALARSDSQQELAADFASLFLLPPPAGVSPYAGHYPHTTSVEARRAMRQWLVTVSLAPLNNEPADHIAIQLALMAALVEKAGKSFAKQKMFLHEHLLSWVPLLGRECSQRDKFGFYAAALDLLVTFLQQDAQWINDELLSPPEA